MTLRDLQELYSDKLIVVELGQPACNQVFDGFIASIPENLLNRKIVSIDTDYSPGTEWSWLIVNIEPENTKIITEERFDFSQNNLILTVEQKLI